MATKLIGKGAFTKAYLLDSGRVLLKSCDPIKECMAWGWFPEHELFPHVTMIDTGVYEMDYYPRVRSLKSALQPEQYALYKQLRSLCAGLEMPRNTYDNYSYLYDAFSNSNLAQDIKDVLLEALDACANIGPQMWFEISPRNVAVKDGKLVLLDVFFCTQALKNIRNS